MIKDREEGAVQFDAVIRQWKQYHPNWKKLYPTQGAWREGEFGLEKCT